MDGPGILGRRRRHDLRLYQISREEVSSFPLAMAIAFLSAMMAAAGVLGYQLVCQPRLG